MPARQSSDDQAVRPQLLSSDNLTPPARTPWGGRKILDHYKRDLALGEAGNLAVCGEAWEVSVEPSFPSRLASTGALLGDVIAADPVAWLGHKDADRYGGQTPLLVKLLDAASSLSVQVHPAEDDPELGSDESGKYEVWYVLDAEPGAGVHMGFADGVTRARVERCVRSGGRLDELLNFVPVAPGDVFAIHPGTVHAIGAGITLVEPQWVWPGRRGVTYRYWDWNRRYDERGRECATGAPRALHLERSLAVTRWDAPRGAAFVDLCRQQPRVIQAGTLARTELAALPRFTVERWAGTGTIAIPAQATLLAIVCVRGSADVITGAGQTAVQRGQSMVVPAACGALEVHSPASPAAPAGSDSSHEPGVELIVTRCS